MAELSKLFVTIGAKTDQFEKGLDKVAKKTKGIGVAMTAAGAAITAALALAVKATDTFNQALRDIQVETGATGAALRDLEQTFSDVFTQLPVGAEALSGTIAQLSILTGATGDILKDLTTQVVETSRLLGEDAAQNATAFGRALRQWQIPAEDGILLMDKLFKATQTSGLGFNDLIWTVNTYGPVLANAGFTMEESADLFNRMAENGIDVSRVMPGLNAAFRRMAERGLPLRETLERVVDKMKDAGSEVEALNIAASVFGAEGAQRITAAVRNNVLDFDTLGQSFEEVGGLIEETGQKNLTLGEQFQILGNNIKEGAVKPIGDLLIPKIEAFIKKIQPTIDRIKDWIAEHPKLVEKIVLVAAAIGVLMTVLGPLLLILPGIAAAIGLVSSAMAFLAANPIVILVALIVGVLIAAIILLNRHWDNIIKKIKEVAKTVRDFFVKVWENARDVFMNIVGAIRGAIRFMIDGFREFISVVQTAIATLLAFFGIGQKPQQTPRMGGQFSLMQLGLGVSEPPLGLQAGGIVTQPTVSLIGEAGPEAVIPLSATGEAGIEVTTPIVVMVDGVELAEVMATAMGTLVKERQRVEPAIG